MSQSIESLIAAQRAALARQPRRPLADRREDLRRLQALVSEDLDAWTAAVSADFGNRSPVETQLLELSGVARAARQARRELSHWMAPRPVPTPLLAAPGRSRIRYEPKGVVGIVSPWNYPVQLALVPLAAALAAGCRVLIKPSELTPRTNALMAERLARHFLEDQVAVVQGGPEVAAAFTDQAFDHILFTGSTQVGRKVAQAAAEKLIPLTLELGGKSPVIVDPDYGVDDLAHPLAWGRFTNGGQTCVAPDHVLAVGGPERARAIAEAVIAQAGRFYPDLSSNPDYTSIISPRHYERLLALVEEARAAGAQVLQLPHDAGLSRQTRRFAPTVVIDPPPGLAVTIEEIFGPILPVISVPTVQAAIDHVRGRDHPLALYVFSRSRGVVDQVLDQTLSGGVTVNGTMLHLANDNLPFGGVGASGYGAYHGQQGFLEFSHARSVFATGRWHSTRLAAAPFGKRAHQIAKMAFKA